jgi:hypothetical protein
MRSVVVELFCDDSSVTSNGLGRWTRNGLTQTIASFPAIVMVPIRTSGAHFRDQ